MGPDLNPVWKRTTVGLPPNEDLGADQYEAATKWVVAIYQAVEGDARSRSRPLIPPGTPVVHGGLVIYAGDRGLAARAITAGTGFGDRFQPGDLFWLQETEGGLVHMARELGRRITAEAWLKGKPETPHADRFPHRTLTHRIATWKDDLVFVDDLGLLPPPAKPSPLPLPHGPFTEQMRTSFVRQVDPHSGKLRIKFGGEESRALDRELPAELYSLSVPLVRDNTWYFVIESERRVRLLRLDPWEYHKGFWAKFGAGMRDRGLAAGRKWEAELATAPLGVGQDTHRRPHAIHLAETDGLMIAPTHLGRIVAVDQQTGKSRWTHEYAPLEAKRFPTFAPEWVVVPPAVVRDRFVYAPADFPEILCLSVADGKKAWGVKKGDGLYPAVVGEQVLVVGEKAIRSLSLKDGSEQWQADLPGLPCGRGAVLGETYLVPVSEPKTWRGMIAVVDLKAGKVIEVLKSDAEQPIGNLVVHQDFLISQTLTEIAVFPIKK